MLQKLLEQLRPWAEAMAELDDPQGEYLLRLEHRISRFEGEVELLREISETDSSAAMKPTSDPESDHRIG